MAHQRGVDDGDPRRHLAVRCERRRPVPCPLLSEPFCRVTHRGDGPHQRARPGLQIAGMLAVPCGPAAGGAEPGVLAARHERGAALLTGPDISHRVMLRVACAAPPDTPPWKPPRPPPDCAARPGSPCRARAVTTPCSPTA